MFCTSCGEKNDKKDCFCVNCRAALPKKPYVTPAEGTGFSNFVTGVEKTDCTPHKKRKKIHLIVLIVGVLLVIAVAFLINNSFTTNPAEDVVRTYLESVHNGDFDTKLKCLGMDGKNAIIRAYGGLENGIKEFEERLNSSESNYGYRIDYDYFYEWLGRVETVEELYELNLEYVMAVTEATNQGSLHIIGMESKELSGYELQRAKQSVPRYYENAGNIEHIYNIEDISAYYWVRVELERVYPDWTDHVSREYLVVKVDDNYYTFGTTWFLD